MESSAVSPDPRFIGAPSLLLVGLSVVLPGGPSSVCSKLGGLHIRRTPEPTENDPLGNGLLCPLTAAQGPSGDARFLLPFAHLGSSRFEHCSGLGSLTSSEGLYLSNVKLLLSRSRDISGTFGGLLAKMEHSSLGNTPGFARRERLCTTLAAVLADLVPFSFLLSFLGFSLAFRMS